MNCDIKSGDTVAIWGCGPVAQFAIRSAFMLGAERVIAIDRFPYRLQMAQDGGAETINYEEVDDVVQTLKEMTANIGPDSCMDAVGMEAHDNGFMYKVDRAKQALKVESDRPIVLRQCIQACRKGGTVSVPGVYSGLADKIPLHKIAIPWPSDFDAHRILPDRCSGVSLQEPATPQLRPQLLRSPAILPQTDARRRSRATEYARLAGRCSV